jgi:hypothetical protein
MYCRFCAVLILSHLSQILPSWSRVCLCKSSSSPASLTRIIAHPDYALAGPDPIFAHTEYAYACADPIFDNSDYAVAGADPIFAHPKIQLAQ